ncbi:MAG: response regulator [Caulobacter sp.]|jgi:CheY-like chemotaxis protein
MAGEGLEGLKVLIVEDEIIVSMLLEDMLADFGCEVVGPANDVAAALELVRSATLDAAVLDVNLNGAKSYPIADALRERGVPFAFASGYGASGLDDGYQETPTLAKPFRQADLKQILSTFASAA